MAKFVRPIRLIYHGVEKPADVDIDGKVLNTAYDRYFLNVEPRDLTKEDLDSLTDEEIRDIMTDPGTGQGALYTDPDSHELPPLSEKRLMRMTPEERKERKEAEDAYKKKHTKKPPKSHSDKENKDDKNDKDSKTENEFFFVEDQQPAEAHSESSGEFANE